MRKRIPSGGIRVLVNESNMTIERARYIASTTMTTTTTFYRETKKEKELKGDCSVLPSFLRPDIKILTFLCISPPLSGCNSAAGFNKETKSKVLSHVDPPRCRDSVKGAHQENIVTKYTPRALK